MQNKSVHDIIYDQMDHFLSKSINENNQLTLSKVMEIASWVSAYNIRQRHLEQGNISEDEMQMVLGAIGNFCYEHFKENFAQEEFNLVTTKTLDLLKTPTFDQDSKDYFEQFYHLK
ncbi:hypothetical protein ACF3NR_01315 [Vaginella massiliensis]|uniref:hypothetical protein n=1 Tax=Vaginella massiliensis TaxID=1816680 RepID=UPI000837F65D|nr:hypothetical protein [Vaginella massiliensis]